MRNEELRAGHPHPIINAQGIRHKAQVGADIICPKEKAPQLVGEGLRALPKKEKNGAMPTPHRVI